MESHQAPPSAIVFLLNFGGPQHLSQVYSFIYEILRDKNTVHLPAPQWIQNLFAGLISLKRFSEVKEQYAAMGGKSPIVDATEQLAQCLETALAQAGHTGVRIIPVHRYLAGQAAEALSTLRAHSLPPLYVLPLYPHFCYATTGSSVQQIDQLLKKQHSSEYPNPNEPLRAIHSYADHPLYIDAMADKINDCITAANLNPQDSMLLCSAHGLPADYVEKKGDLYLRELQKTVTALKARFPAWQIVMSFQSRVGPKQWLKPYTDEIIPELGKQEGLKNMVFVPISFVNDHLETIYEIGETYFQLVREQGLTPWRADAIEVHPKFVACLATLIEDMLKKNAGVDARALLPPPQPARVWANIVLTTMALLFATALWLII